MIRIGVINVSDRAHAGVYEDLPGKEVVRLLKEWLSVPYETEYAVVPDEHDDIADAICGMADEKGCCLIVTTGGTGPSPRDITPDVTGDMCEKMLPGFGELMRAVSLQKVPTAILSRQTAGIRGKCLIVNLPGKPKAIAECLTSVFPAIPYCIDLIGGPKLQTHAEKILIFRPPTL